MRRRLRAAAASAAAHLTAFGGLTGSLLLG
jgi:hypothetical protein